MSRSNVEIVFAGWLDAIRRGDLATMAEALAPDAVHQGVEPGLICRNAGEILASARGRARAAAGIQAVELVAAGEHVVLSLRGPGLGPPVAEDAEPVGAAFIVFTLRDGRIVRMQDHRARAEALAAAGVAPPW